MDGEITIYRIGFCSALIAFVGAAGYALAQILQIAGVVGAPWDEILIYGCSLLIAPPFLLAMIALHHVTKGERRFWSLTALFLAAMYVTYVTLNYAVQLAAVIPFEAPNPTIVQTPHSLFWVVDALGYIAFGLATLFAMPVFSNRGLEKWLRRFFLANGLITPVIAFVYFYPKFSATLLLLGSPWIVTAPGSLLLLSLYFRAETRQRHAVR